MSLVRSRQDPSAGKPLAVEDSGLSPKVQAFLSLSSHHSERNVRKPRERFSGSPGVFEKEDTSSKKQKPTVGLAKGHFIGAAVSGLRD